MGVKLVLG